jgi:hypothetical protein
MRKLTLMIILFLLGASLTGAVDVFSEDFEDGVIPSEWSQEYVIGEVNWQVHDGGQNNHPPQAQSGNFNAWFFDSNVDGNTIRLITPEFEITTHAKLSFWYVQDSWTTYQDYLRVYYRTSLASEWVLLAYLEEEATAWTEIILDLPEPSATYQIAFEGEAYWGYGVCVDNILVQDCVINILVWDNDNNSDFIDPNNNQYYTCEQSITQALDALNLEYVLASSLPRDLDFYDVVMIALGIYCVG